MNKAEIRKAEIEDTPELVPLLEQLGYKSTEIELRNTLATNQRNDEIYVALIDNKLVALMSIIYFDYFPSQEKICRITAIVVDSNVRGSGVGRQLIEFAKDLSKKRCCAKLEVTTSLAREATQQYYENIGFTKSSYRYIQDIAG